MAGESQQHLLAQARQQEEVEMANLEAASQPEDDHDENSRKAEPEGEAHLKLETLFPKTLPLIYLIPPTVAVVALLASRGRKYTGDLLVDVSTTNGRATAQVLVQIISHVLGMLQVMVLGSMLSFALRLMLASGRSTTLHTLSFWTSLSPARFNYTLPPFYLFTAIGLLFLSLIPGALWAGALSPITTTASNSSESILVPAFTNRSARLWDSQFQWNRNDDGHLTLWNVQDDCVRNNGSRGFIPSCPVPDLQSLLLFSGSSATPLDRSIRNHSKFDNPAWQYMDRSYGVGASVGLVDDGFSSSHVEAYSYTEVGYEVQVKCIKNSSSHFGIQHTRSLPSSLQIYHAEGWLPNMFDSSDFDVNLNDSYGYNESYPTLSWYNDYRDMAAWVAHTSDSGSMIGVATGKKGRYTELNQTQCEVEFVPATFKINANRTQHSIRVTRNNSDAKNLEPTGRLRWVAMNSINLLARMSPSLYVSVLGDTLERNYNNMKTRHPDKSEEDAVTAGIAEAFTAMIDDILVAYGASQLVHANDSIRASALTHYSAVQIGKSSTYLYLVTAMDIIVVVIFAFEAVRTRLWHELPEFSYLDIKSIVVSASAGGTKLADEVELGKNISGVRVGEVEVALQPGGAGKIVSRNAPHPHGWIASDKIVSLHPKILEPKT